MMRYMFRIALSLLLTQVTVDLHSTAQAQQWRQPGRLENSADAKPISPEAQSSGSNSSARWAVIARHRIDRTNVPRQLPWREVESRVVLASHETDSNEPSKATHSRSVRLATSSSSSASTTGPRRSQLHLVQSVPIDPFDDPFGDRYEEPEPTTPIAVQPSYAPETLIQEEVPAEPAQPAFGDAQPSFGDSQPSFGDETPPGGAGVPESLLPRQLEPDASIADEPPVPGADAIQEPGGESGYAPPSISEQLEGLAPDEEPCDRIYNGRNCCTEHKACLALREQLASTSIRHISLDITPRLKPNSSRTDEARDRTLRMARTPIRSWRNRRGDVIARGQMTNFIDGRVLIDSDGDVREVPFATLSDDDMCFVTAWWDIPTECVLANGSLSPRDWYLTTMTWKASAVCHKPLYFEEVQLERYGHTTGPLVQPVLSSAHFFLNIATLPYKMGIHPPNECRYPLGYYRPGNCAPWLVPPVPLSLRGGLMQAGAIVGGIYIFP